VKRCWGQFVILLFLIGFSGTPGCGSSSRRLQSITIYSPGGSSTEVILYGSGAFNTSPTTINPLPVSWYVVGPGLQPTATYSLGTQSFVFGCGSGDTAVALAPVDPSAPNNGSIPAQAFQDLVIAHTESSESGFVAAAMLAPAKC
jgi:hypothetical protein